jgi:DTW domain-containing protein
VTLVVHAKELKRTTNTGRLALHALVNSEMRVRGEDHGRMDLSDLLSTEYESYVLYPADDAIELDGLKPLKAVQLIVADGNWRQASKVHNRHPELSHLPRLKISHKNLSEHHLRKEHMENGLSTLEAIALALKVIEGESVGEKLLGLYRAKLHATLVGRGLHPNF